MPVNGFSESTSWVMPTVKVTLLVGRGPESRRRR